MTGYLKLALIKMEDKIKEINSILCYLENELYRNKTIKGKTPYIKNEILIEKISSYKLARRVLIYCLELKISLTEFCVRVQLPEAVIRRLFDGTEISNLSKNKY